MTTEFPPSGKVCNRLLSPPHLLGCLSFLALLLLAFLIVLSVLVFVFLLSRSKNSMAIWRRKVPIPPEIKAFYAPSLAPVVAALNRKYPIYLDEYVS